MSFWTCAIELGGAAGAKCAERFRRDLGAHRYVRSASTQWYDLGPFAAAVGSENGSSRGALATVGPAVAVGTVRLDNRDEIARLLGSRGYLNDVPDLELVLRWLIPYLGNVANPESTAVGHHVRHADSKANLRTALRALLGDFAFVAWHPMTRRLITARDAFGVKKLFCAIGGGTSAAFGSRAELLARNDTGDAYDLRYLVGLLSEQRFEEQFGLAAAHSAANGTDFERTAFAGVNAVPAAGLLTVDDDVQHLTRYWSAYDVMGSGLGGRADSEHSPRDRVAAFRSLLLDAVRVRLDRPLHTWSHLSGGLDSSSVVCVAEHLARGGAIANGLAGTISFVEPAVTAADERVFSDAVVRKYAVPNRTIPHVAGWREAVVAPPLFDQPNQSHLIAVRDLAAARIVREAGGSILLTGSGGDQLLLTTMFFFADQIARGQIVAAVREMAHWAALGRVSFWELAYKNAVLPLLPAWVRHPLMPRAEDGPTPWLTKAVTRRYGVARRRGIDRAYAGRRGHKYEDALAGTLATSGAWVADRFADELLDLRHPFLYRPLVEFALGLPPEMCARPHARKWILREAMRGILPEEVRTRVGKAGGRGMILRSMIRDRALLLRLLRDPLLAQLGCIDPEPLRSAVENASNEHRAPPWLSSRAVIAIEVELWLQIRAGQLATDAVIGARAAAPRDSFSHNTRKEGGAYAQQPAR
jgi:asparagine synthase (glutamine-hydrolysing)